MDGWMGDKDTRKSIRIVMTYSFITTECINFLKSRKYEGKFT